MREIPSTVRPLLREYVTAMQNVLPRCVEGLYVHGSIALDAYVENASDIDFVTMVNRQLSEGDIQKVSEIHLDLSKKYTHPQMDGMYLQWNSLGKDDRQIDPYPYYNANMMHASGYINQNPVTWWILKHRGITILGPAASQLNIEVDDHALLEYVHQNMNTYWANRLNHMKNNRDQLEQLPEASIDEEIEWSVLGMLRQYYTLRERDIISKSAAGRYALLHAPEGWHRVIREALRIRQKADECYYSSNAERIAETLAFLHYILEDCNANYSSV